ncbi:heavy-metal-associated domain-containing protein [Polynucleobacter campilacus]|nr:heavy-metal-associated domain-containing protein [Polynucleobacter campilacus]
MEDNLLNTKQSHFKRVDMLSLKVSGMTCGGCIKAVTKAIQSQDPQAKVEADLASQMVSLETSLSAEQASQIITDAGFPVSQ